MNDIGSMLADLTDELDAMLHMDRGEGGGPNTATTSASTTTTTTGEATAEANPTSVGGQSPN